MDHFSPRISRNDTENLIEHDIYDPDDSKDKIGIHNQ